MGWQHLLTTHITWSNTAQFPMTAKKRWKYFSDCSNLRKQPTFRDVATDFPAKWRLRNECRNSTLMTCHYPVLESTSDWLLSVPREKFASTIQKHYKNLGTVTGHQYGICALVFGRSFPRATIAGNNENNSPTIMAIVYKKRREQQHLISTRRF